uniref:Poly [ADP-ribose] polymerase n=1 Tax=Clastoptera arizonana TaxID=38151 RepID=A0A1B6CY90_9HEMI
MLLFILGLILFWLFYQKNRPERNGEILRESSGPVIPRFNKNTNFNVIDQQLPSKEVPTKILHKKDDCIQVVKSNRNGLNAHFNVFDQYFTLEVPNKTYKQEYWKPVISRNINNLQIINNVIFCYWTYKYVTDNYNLIHIQLNSEEAKLVFNTFYDNAPKNYKINKITRIENHYLYAMYLLKKEEMKCRNGDVNEINVYHGTKRKNIISICNDNFDWRRCGDAIGHRFGQGVSFTPKPTYAIHYCNKGPRKTMFLVKVLVSKAVEGNSDMIIPYNSLNGKIQFYDTSVKPNIDVIVKYGDNEFYPHYIIEFFDT